MPPARRRPITQRQMVRLVRRWQRRLLLHDWHITVEVRPIADEDDAKAYCEASPEYLQAKLTFDPNEISADEAEPYAVHELLHCYAEILAGLAGVLAGEDAGRKEAVRQAEEQMVTRLERMVRVLVAE